MSIVLIPVSYLLMCVTSISSVLPLIVLSCVLPPHSHFLSLSVSNYCLFSVSRYKFFFAPNFVCLVLSNMGLLVFSFNLSFKTRPFLPEKSASGSDLLHSTRLEAEHFQGSSDASTVLQSVRGTW